MDIDIEKSRQELIVELLASCIRLLSWTRDLSSCAGPDWHDEMMDDIVSAEKTIQKAKKLGYDE